MSFSRSEFLRGALSAWLWFLVIHQVALLAPLWGYGFLALYFTLPWSFGALVIGSPFAFLLGRALRNVRRVWVHEVAFAGFGLVVGVLTTAVCLGLTHRGLGYLGDWWWSAVLVAASACPPVLLGWRFGSRRARRPDPSGVRHRRADPDAEYEDSLTA